MTITSVSIQLLVSPNAYDTVHLPITTGDLYWPQPQDSRDFFVANGSSFRPTDWMLERGPPVVAFLYWDLAISHNSGGRFDIFYHYYINPPPDTPFPLHIYRLIDPPGFIHRGVPSGRIYSNCPPQLSPTPLPPLDPFDTNIRARFLFSHLFLSDDDFEMLAAVQFYSNEECPEGNGFTPTIQPSLSTQVNEATAGLNTGFYDTATLSGGSNPRGNITFTLYDPDMVVVQQATVPVAGNGQYASPIYVPTRTGLFQYKAHYSGDRTNKSATVVVGAINENVIVTTRGGQGTRNVPVRIKVPLANEANVAMRINLSPLHPGISRNPNDGTSRVWYKRTGA